MRSFSPPLLTLFIAGLAFPCLSEAASSREEAIRELREQIRQLDQRLRLLEEQVEVEKSTAVAPPPKAPELSAGERGFALASADRAHTLRLRALIHADARWFLADGSNRSDAFILRRARMIFEGTVNRLVDYRVTPEFGGTSGNGSLTLQDAHLTFRFSPQWQVRVGRFHEPVGLEQLQSDSVAAFIERSLVSQFVPNRDIGVQVGGDWQDGTVSYAIGLFNGVADGSSSGNNADNNDEKDLAARMFVQPFRQNADSPWAGLGFGLGASYGRQSGQAGGLTGGYRTEAQQPWFQYRSTVVAEGDSWRLSPQAYYYRGPFGAMAEYVVSSVEAVNGAVRHRLRHRAWQATAGYVLTGERAGYGGVTPAQPFDLAANTWGAWEVVARVADAAIDERAFENGGFSLANAATSAAGVRSYGVGVNWYFSKAVRSSLNLLHSDFRLSPQAPPASAAPVREDENALMARWQLAF